MGSKIPAGSHQKPPYNLLIITGEMGTGKTLLARAILKDFQKQFPSYNVFQTSYECLLLYTLDKHLDPEFFDQYHLILIDSYTSTFSNDSIDLSTILKNVRSKVIITCVTDLNPDFEHSRIHLTHADQDDKIEILKKFSMNNNVHLTEEIILFIAQLKFPNTRNLLNFTNDLVAR